MKSNEVIKSVNYSQHAILRDILDLHCDGNSPDVDLTYSIGNFYGTFRRKVSEKNPDGTTSVHEEEFEIPQPKYKFDVDPQGEDVVKIDLGGLFHCQTIVCLLLWWTFHL